LNPEQKLKQGEPAGIRRRWLGIADASTKIVMTTSWKVI
jgi:hypothetical protein